MCDSCALTFGTRELLNNHRGRIHGTKGGDMCSICEKTFTNGQRLKSHMRLHPAEAMNCTECKSELSSKYALIRHMKNNHKDKSQEDTALYEQENENEEKEDDPDMFDDDHIEETEDYLGEFSDPLNDCQFIIVQ
jgi:hypothetical protein